MNTPAKANTGISAPAVSGITALLSVSDKSGLLEFAAALNERGVRLLSTGGTARALREGGLEVVEVSEHTGFPEIMGGRVKTLHPKIHGGILARRDVDADVMQQHGIDAIDLLVVNLYPFAETIARPGCTIEEAIENIDIGGPAMIRAAAKNHQYVSVVTDPADYSRVLESIGKANQSGQSEEGLHFRRELAAKAYAHTAGYDAKITDYLSSQTSSTASGSDNTPGSNEIDFPDSMTLTFSKLQNMRYGENPHQQAAFYRAESCAASSIAGAKLLQGKELSFNNVSDSDAALECVKEFADTTCVIVKHANPCGVASGSTAREAYERAFACDPTSAFGGILAFNVAIDGSLAEHIIERQFVEVLIAPGFSAEALESLQRKPQIRVLQVSDPLTPDRGMRLSSVSGGLLVQSADVELLGNSGLSVVTEKQPSAEQSEDLMFAWRVAKYVKSNAIVFAKNRQSIGVGAGQMSRVYSARIGAIKASDESLEIRGSVLASDAFFPFRDGIDSAAEVGVSAVIQPGGSRNDEEVIKAANEHGLSMVFTGMRHFRH